MKEGLAAGLTTTRKITVDRVRTIDFMGDEGRVYATPSLIADIEYTCRDLAFEELDAGEDSVGTRVEIDHLAATLEGMWVEITATVAAVEGRLVTFAVTARDPVDDPIAKGRHMRFVVDVAKTKERLAAKAAKAAS